MLRRAASVVKRSLHAPAHALLPRHATARPLYDEMRHLTRAGGDFTVHNYVAVLEDLSEEATTVETELFPREALDFYTRWNLEEAVSDEEIDAYKTPERGGAQGDYRRGMRRKIANAVDCLRTHENSKAGLDTIPFTDSGSETIDWRDQGQTKCCSELYLYVEEGRLSCTGVLRVQNASIFPEKYPLLRRPAAAGRGGARSAARRLHARRRVALPDRARTARVLLDSTRACVDVLFIAAIATGKCV